MTINKALHALGGVELISNIRQVELAELDAQSDHLAEGEYQFKYNQIIMRETKSLARINKSLLK